MSRGFALWLPNEETSSVGHVTIYHDSYRPFFFFFFFLASHSSWTVGAYTNDDSKCKLLNVIDLILLV